MPNTRLTAPLVTVLALAASAALAAPPPTGPDTQAEVQRHETWRGAMAHTPAPGQGCYASTYPALTWTAVPCHAAPPGPYLPRAGHSGFTVGNGNDYLAVVSGHLGAGVGSFPTVTGITQETGYGGRPNTYSLQLNANFFTSPTCATSKRPALCQGWEQFVYTNSGSAFMQYWLLSYGTPCPAGWNGFQGSCYRNSAAVSVPPQGIDQLASLRLSGSAVADGIDTLVMTTASNAYSTTGKDSVVGLAGGWTGAEFNIVGDGGASAARFNRGTSMTVKVQVSNGGTAAPSCLANSGTTGETNNLRLGRCVTSGGAEPAVSFTQFRK